LLAEGLASGRNAWPGLAEQLSTLLDGDGSQALATADGYWGRGDDGRYDDHVTDAYIAISALDAPYPAGFARADFDAFVSEQVIPVGPLLGPTGALSERMSVGWPFDRGRPLPRIDARDAPPLLVLGGLDDPTTPVAFAREMRDALGNGSTLVTRDDQTHGQFFSSECVREYVVAFLVDPTAPIADAACPFEPSE